MMIKDGWTASKKTMEKDESHKIQAFDVGQDVVVAPRTNANKAESSLSYS
jgi:hypothetical protein